MKKRDVKMRFSSTLLFISIMNETDTARSNNIRACLHGGGGPQIGEVTCGGSPYLSRKPDQFIMKDFMDRRVTPRKWVTSPTWGPSPPCKQALNGFI